MAIPRAHASSSFSFFSAVTRRRHDVFLSFRGEDTRHSITKTLHKALEDAGVPTFKDDVNLEKGGDIASELLKSIQMSRIAVIVLSRNYASSRWCLDELVKIVECKNEAGQILLPVFYDVDPSDDLLSEHEERYRLENLEGKNNKVESWRAALTDAASSPVGFGWDMQQENVGSWHQSSFIKEIVKHVLSRRQDAYLTASIFPPKMEAAKEYLNLILSTVISDDILVIGIWGTDNTVMANIAKAVYNQNFRGFEASTFLSDVSRIAEDDNGLIALQKQFISDILMEDDDNSNSNSVEIDNVEKGTSMIKNVLRGKRVLAVLDNVNDLEQINALARKRDWFGSGSRIIVTTRDPQLLNVLEVDDDIYGGQGIQVIKDQYVQNLQTINSLVEYIRNFEAQMGDQGGGDLMLPDINVPSEDLPSFLAGEPWAVEHPSNPVPIAAGATTTSSMEALNAVKVPGNPASPERMSLSPPFPSPTPLLSELPQAPFIEGSYWLLQ